LTHATPTSDDEAMATPPRTGGLTEIGELLNVSRQRAYALAKRADFPPPVATSRAGRTWNLTEVAKWETTWDRDNKGGRPKTTEQPPAED
jgi:predicted DNA-binding transcriptional regulator AlpA